MRRGSATVLVGFLLAILGCGLASSTYAAYAAGTATGDSVDVMSIDYRVTPDGVLKVREEIVYRFGFGSGRHGIYRDLVIREPYIDDDSKDQRYDVSNIAVSSPTGARAEFTEETTRENDARNQVIRLKIGSADVTITDPTETYVITYDVKGALRHFDDRSELYWDATGTAWDAVLKQVRVSVEVPDGVQRVECFAGPNGSTAPCTSKTVTGGKAAFAQTELPRGSGLTIVAAIKPGVVSNDTPLLDDPPGLLERAGLSVPMVAGAGAVALGVPFLGVIAGRRVSRDQRYAGVPPGTLPPAGASVPIADNTLSDDQIPVAFAPPRIPVAEGGLLIDATASTRETAATLIDLAVRGAVRIDNTGNEQHAVLLDHNKATEWHEQMLIRHLFPTGVPGSSIPLERRPVGDTSMRRAHDAMVAAVREQVERKGWYSRMPGRGRGSGSMPGGAACGIGCFAVLWVFGGGIMGVIAAFAGGGGNGLAWVIGLPGVMIVATFVYYLWMRSRGRRTPLGRALTDQVIGFRTYLATAEADQLRFEEGEDIFSKYLPWAIVFDLADRWQRICAQLVAAGRIPADPYWYSGPSYYYSGFAAGSISDTVARTFDPPPTPSSSGGGGGSSSGFSGGSSGGGGGGGGGGSW
jgi:uncharacterized membrane protein YgcG